MINKTNKGTFLDPYYDNAFNGVGCDIIVKQETIEDNQARTHIEIKDTYGWQNLTIKHIKPASEYDGFGKIEIDVTGNWESAALAKAFIKIGENIIKNNPSYIADKEINDDCIISKYINP